MKKNTETHGKNLHTTVANFFQKLLPSSEKKRMKNSRKSTSRKPTNPSKRNKSSQDNSSESESVNINGVEKLIGEWRDVFSTLGICFEEVPGGFRSRFFLSWPEDFSEVECEVTGFENSLALCMVQTAENILKYDRTRNEVPWG